MTVRYHQRGGKRIVPDYLCQKDGIARGQSPCQRIPGRDLDAAVTALLLETVSPQMVAQVLRIQDELLERADEAHRLRQRLIERAQYEADLAQRRYLKVDPNNRLVAGVLETEWNEKLKALANAREAAEQHRLQDQVQMSEQAREEILKATSTFASIWSNPRTSDRERKRIIGLLIEDVTLQKQDVISAHIRFKGGATRSIRVSLPPPFNQSRLTPADTLAKIDQLLDFHTDAEIAEKLNAQGQRTYAGLPFQANHVSQLRRKHGLKDRFTRLREAGLLTVEELAETYGVKPQTIWRWYHHGLIQGECYNDRGSRLFRPFEAGLPVELDGELPNDGHPGQEVQYAM
jgi:hypothetical protein